MKSLLFAIGIVFASTAFAGETTLEDVASVAPLTNQWSTNVGIHGGRADSGIGIGIETPTWHSLGARLNYSFDNLDDSANSFEFNTLEAALKWLMVRGSSEGIVPYFVFGLTSFSPVKSGVDTGGSRTGSEFGFGAEWRYKMLGILNDNTNNAAVVIEVLKSSSSFRTPVTSGSIVVRDGAQIRLGFRTFL